MSRRTHNYNAYESELTGPLNIGANSVAVLSAAGLQDPIYLIIDPDVPAKREWVRVNTINGNTLENIVRNLEGSVGDVLHDTGAKVRSVPTSQIFDDVFSDIEDDELDLTQHETDGGDPHAQAGYLQDSDVNGVYLKLTGGTLSGFLTLVADPTSPAHAATKNYVDNQDHDHATPIGVHSDDVAAHNSKVNVAGDNMSGILDLGANKITSLADGSDPQDAVTKVQLDTISAGQPVNHADLLLPTADDHSEYHNDARGDARYYTKAQVDSLLAGKAPTTHNHTAAQTTSGTFLTARIPNLNANKITAGTFGAGGYTFPGALGIAGAFNANTTVNFSGLAVNAGGVQLRLVGSALTKAS
jgi:hypothetical protein